MNRLGPNPPSATDNEKRGLELTARLLRRLVVEEVPITIEKPVNPEGWIFFSVGFQALKIRPSEFRMIPYYRSPLLSNFIGGILLRKNLNEFDTLLTDMPGNEYNLQVRNLHSTVCGLWIEPSGLKAQMHLSVLYAAINEHLCRSVES